MCGIGAVFFSEGTNFKYNVPKMAVRLMKGQKGRGSKGAGIGTFTHGKKGYISYHKGADPIEFVFCKKKLRQISGQIAIVQNRYATDGHVHSMENVQPLHFVEKQGYGFIAHNGNLTCKRAKLQAEASDTWNIVWKFTQLNGHRTVLHRFREALAQIAGSYCIAMLYQDRKNQIHLLVARDYHGVHPLYIGRVGEESEGWAVASETRALKKIGATSIREVQPGEVIQINNSGMISEHLMEDRPFPCAECPFELAYFMNHKSKVACNKGEWWKTGKIREAFGARTWEEYKDKINPEKVDCIVPIPRSANLQGKGLSEASGIPIKPLIIRNRNSQRTYLSVEARNDPKAIAKMIDEKFSFNKKEFKQVKRIILVDDSLVRAHTLRRIIRRIHLINPDIEIIVMICFPAIIAPCFYGLAMSTITELGWHRFGKLNGLKQKTKADELLYLSPKGMLNVLKKMLGKPANEWCRQCYEGKLPPGLNIERGDYRKEWKKFKKTT